MELLGFLWIAGGDLFLCRGLPPWLTHQPEAHRRIACPYVVAVPSSLFGAGYIFSLHHLRGTLSYKATETIRVYLSSEHQDGGDICSYLNVLLVSRAKKFLKIPKHSTCYGGSRLEPAPMSTGQSSWKGLYLSQLAKSDWRKWVNSSSYKPCSQFPTSPLAKDSPLNSLGSCGRGGALSSCYQWLMDWEVEKSYELFRIQWYLQNDCDSK